MKANELMIGDFVTFNDCQNDKEKVVVKIWQINQEGNALVFIDDSKALDEIAIDDEIVGIPLTPEILEKNGFVEITKRIKKLIWLWKENGVLVELLEETPNVYKLTIHHDSSDLSDQRLYVRQLHELQNALKLCGIEKIIEL